MVDRTVYNSKETTPDLALRQVFGRHKTPSEVCVLFANNNLLSIEVVAVLGDSHDSVRRNFAMLIGGEEHLGSSDQIKTLRIIQVIAVWTSCSHLNACTAQRRAKMEEDPHRIPEIPQEDHGDFRSRFVSAHEDMILNMWNEPHKKFVERVHRDYIVNGSIPFYEVGEMRTRSEVIAQKSGLAPSADQLVRLCRTDELISSFATEEEVFHRLNAFFMTLELLNICSFTLLDGPVAYISELHKFRRDTPGLAALVRVDKIIRLKIAECNTDFRDSFPTFAEALKHVLSDHKHLWIEARSFRSSAAPTTPQGKRPSSEVEGLSPGNPAKLSKSAKKREDLKAKLQGARPVAAAPAAAPKGKNKGAQSKGAAASGGSKFPQAEWEKIGSLTYSGPRRCRFFNSSIGCSMTATCKQDHKCVECGAGHPYIGNH